MLSIKCGVDLSPTIKPKDIQTPERANPAPLWDKGNTSPTRANGIGAQPKLANMKYTINKDIGIQERPPGIMPLASKKRYVQTAINTPKAANPVEKSNVRLFIIFTRIEANRALAVMMISEPRV